MVVVLVEDLIMEILLRVPPVSILKFKSVCKSWYSLISNPCFYRNHARQFHLSQRDRCVVDPPGLLFSPQFRCYEHYSLYDILSQDRKPDPRPLLKLNLDHSLPAFKQQKFSVGSHCSLINSCNGLLLYQTKTKSGIPDQYNVFNPITNQYKEVPIMDIPGTFIKPNQTTLYLSPMIVFDPSLLLSYKILLIIVEPCNTHSQLYVYSDDTGSWRLVTSFAKKKKRYITGKKSFMYNGVFYWLKDHVSICFDFVEENVWFQPLPRIPARYARREVTYFGECGGRLLLIEEYFGLCSNPGLWFPSSFDIMEMEQGSSIWTVKSRVNIEAGYDKFFERLYRVKVIHLYETEEGEETVLLNLDDQKLVSFNITTNTFKMELTIPDFESRATLVNAFPFTPTLFPLLT